MTLNEFMIKAWREGLMIQHSSDMMPGALDEAKKEGRTFQDEGTGSVWVLFNLECLENCVSLEGFFAWVRRNDFAAHAAAGLDQAVVQEALSSNRYFTDPATGQGWVAVRPEVRPEYELPTAVAIQRNADKNFEDNPLPVILGESDAQAEADEKGPELSASEALFGFASWLACCPGSIVFGGSHDAAVAACLVDTFSKANNLTEPREDWNELLAHPEEFPSGIGEHHVEVMNKPERDYGPKVSAGLSFRSEGAAFH